MSATAKVIIKGENQLSPSIKSATNDLNGFSATAQKVGNTIKSAFAITAVIAALKELGSAAKQCFNDFATAERSYKQLALALNDTTAYEKAVKTINTLSRQTLSSKEDIESMVAELAALGKSSDEIDKIATAAVALSNVTGKDLNSSMTTLLNTYNGTTTTLNKLGISTADLTKEELAQGEAVQLVIDKLGDYSVAMAEADSSQHIQNIKNIWGDIKQVIGGVIDYNFKDWFAKIDGGLSNSYDNIVNVINYIGAVIKNFPEVAKLALKTVWEMIKKTFEWNSIKTLFTTAIKNIAVVASVAIKEIFVSIPQLLKQAGLGIINYIAYLAVSIKNTILQTIENVLNAILLNSKNWPSWLKKFLGMDEDGGVFNFHIDPTSADNLKQAADEAFEAIPAILGDAIETAVDGYKEIKDNTKEALDEIYGGVLADFKAGVDGIVGPTLAEIKQYSEASNQTVTGGKAAGAANAGASEINDATDNLVSSSVKFNEVATKYASLLDYGKTTLEKEQKVRDILAAELEKGNLTVEERYMLEAELAAQDKKIIDLKNEEVKAITDNIRTVRLWRKEIQASSNEALSPLTTTFKSLFGEGGRFSKSYWSTETFTDNYGNVHTEQKYNLGGSETALWSSLGSVISDLLSEFSSFVDAIISGCWWLAIIIEILKGFVTEFKPFISQVLNPIKDLLQQFGAALADASVFDEMISTVQMLLPILRAVANIIAPLVSILTTFTRIANDTLMPVIEGLAYVIMAIVGTIEYGIAWLKYGVDSLANWLASWDIAGWKPFKGLEREATNPGSYKAFMSNRFATIETGSEMTYDGSAQTAVANASYTGATSITINIYQQAPVVGDGGMYQFAQMIRDTFEQLDYYGVSA